MDKEGHDVARWFNSLGITAFVLKYRLGPRYRHPAQIRDAQRALRHVRAEAETYGIAPDRLGIMGFSAGGHLAATTATLFDRSFGAPQDSLRTYSARPDLLILAYPVISLTDTFTHEGSRRNLLGDDPDADRLELLSPDQQVRARTPPTFLFSTDADTGVPPENSVAFYLALREADVPAELHVYERGPHGVGMAAGDYALSSWMDRLADWLALHGWLDRPPVSPSSPASPGSQ
jgi:acetyl esterase/lipase